MSVAASTLSPVYIVLLILLAWITGLWLNRRGVARYDGSGEPARAIIIFVEPVRWLFIVWGFNGLCRAIRGMGISHAIYLFRWSRAAGSLLVLPDLMRRERLDTKAARLAKLIDRLAREHPQSTIHLVAYSTGVYLALEAAQQVETNQLGRIIALHGTVSPTYDVSRAASRAKGILSVHGRPDWLINGLGPLLFGTNDRQHTLACGMVGLWSSPPGLEQHAWRPADARLGYLGDHFTVMSSAWLRRHVVPKLTEIEPNTTS